jgi:predicted RNase H-like nuclease (RuvC/YqgF family)
MASIHHLVDNSKKIQSMEKTIEEQKGMIETLMQEIREMKEIQMKQGQSPGR